MSEAIEAIGFVLSEPGVLGEELVGQPEVLARFVGVVVGEEVSRR